MIQERINPENSDTRPVFEQRPISELMSIVKNDFRKFDAVSLIDDGTLVKTVMYCNDKLGINIREIRQLAIPVDDYKAELPQDFEKLFYVCALKCTNGIDVEIKNPFDNNVDQDVVYKAHLDRETLGCVENYKVVVERAGRQVQYHNGNWTQLDVTNTDICHIDSPNRRRGKYSVSINDGFIHTPFKSGLLYIMYLGLMKDEDGNITFPFHPLVTPYYEWSIKEKIIQDAIFNSDMPNLADIYKLSQQEKLKAWIDAFNFTSDPGFGHAIALQKKKELKWYNEYFKYFK